MNLTTLCNNIHLQKEIQEEVIAYSQTPGFAKISSSINGLTDMKTESRTRKELTQLLEPDSKKIKMLTCMLACAADLYPWYQEKGICDTIFFETMCCFTRFIEECRQITGEYAFDREWWTARQVSGNLFRIGELEYEMTYNENTPVISIHIPSDSILTREKCDFSLEMAGTFFEKYFPDYRDKDYICDSWLLAPELDGLLPADSNIIAFKHRFTIQKVSYHDTEYIEWVFKARNTKIADLPENTTLQKNMKRHLLNGGKIGTGWGVLTC